MKALITGATGQDGWYLSELLTSKGYEVYGLVRRTSKPAKLFGCVKPVPGQLECYETLVNAVRTVQPDEIYHLAAQSFVQESFNDPASTFNINTQGTHRLFEAVRNHCPKARVYFAGSSEVFGNSPAPQSETTQFAPESPYGVSKAFGIQLARVYRRAYGIYISCGILFNHESPRRGKEFVTRKITEAARKGLPVELGNVSAFRDWGHAIDYVKAMHLMLQQNEADDFVIATGRTYSVRYFAEMAYGHVGLDHAKYIKINEAHIRKAEVNMLCGNSAKAHEVLNWVPSYTLPALIKDMIDNAVDN